MRYYIILNTYFLNGTITGGTSYQQVTNTDTYFFSRNRGHEGIDIQYKLQGISVIVKAERYSTNIIYTVTSQ